VRGHNTGIEWIRGRVVYAALGDSMSIDDYAGGPGRGAASLLWLHPPVELEPSRPGGDRPIPAVAPSRASSSEHERYAADSHGQCKSGLTEQRPPPAKPQRTKPL
jgi:hypothetical protein